MLLTAVPGCHMKSCFLDPNPKDLVLSMNRDDMMFGFSFLRHNYHTLFILLTSRSHWVWLILTLHRSHHIPSAPADPGPSSDAGSLRYEMRGRVTRVTRVTRLGRGRQKWKHCYYPRLHTALRCTLSARLLTPGLYTRCVHIMRLSLSLDVTCCLPATITTNTLWS